MPRNAPLFVIVAFVLLAGRADAQLDSGPKLGTKIVGFQAHVVTGDNAGKVVDLVSERKDKPTVYVFIQAKDWDRPMARFLKKIDEEFVGGIEGVTDPATVAVWLTDDREKSKDYLPRAQESLNFRRTSLAVFDGGVVGPADWELNTGARLSAVVVRDGKVAGRFGFVSLNETDVPDVLKAIRPK
jgi:hypothetical protein